MKLSVDTNLAQAYLGDEEGLLQIRKAGFDCVDYTFYGVDSYQSPILNDGYVAYAKKMRGVLDEIGLECNQAHAPMIFDNEYGSPFDVSCAPYRSVVRSMEAASILGAKQIVIHPVAIRGALYSDPVEDYNVEFYRSFIPYCEKFNIKIAIENLYNTDRKRNGYINHRCGTPRMLARMLERLDSPWFTACVDLGHAALLGFEPQEFLTEMPKGTVTALHVHDTDYVSDLHQLPFLAKHDWNKIMEALKEIGYTGEFTFEVSPFYSKFPKELIPDALKFSHAVGRYLISLYEKA